MYMYNMPYQVISNTKNSRLTLGLLCRLFADYKSGRILGLTD